MSENRKTMSSRSQSLIAGGLISAAGLFLSKFIGLFYMSPYSIILGGAGSENLANYGLGYNIYAYLLMIATAGFPFAIATLVAKYASRGDYKTVLLIKRLSSRLMIALGFTTMIIVILFSSPLAKLMMGDGNSDISVTRNVLIIISFALFFVPFLSSIRGFYQGMKEMQVYAISQIIEQLVRVGFLLATSAFAVYVLKLDRVWGVYLGLAAASISAIVAYLHLKYHDRTKLRELKHLAAKQECVPNKDKAELIKELIFITVPFLLVSVFGYSDMIVNTLFMKSGLLAHGNTFQEYTTITGIINSNVSKIINIPQILAPGFSSAIIPHITIALEENNLKLIRKNIRDCIDIVLYIGIPVCFCLFLFSKGIYGVLYPAGGKQAMDILNLGADITAWFSLEALFSTIAPIITSLMMALRLRRVGLRNLLIFAVCKVGSSYFFLKWLGYPGLVVSSALGYTLLISLNIYALTKQYHVQWVYTLRKLAFIVLGLGGMAAIATLFNLFGINGYGGSWVTNFTELAVVGLCSVLVYFGITYCFQLPQLLLHIDLITMISKRKRG